MICTNDRLNVLQNNTIEKQKPKAARGLREKLLGEKLLGAMF